MGPEVLQGPWGQEKGGWAGSGPLDTVRGVDGVCWAEDVALGAGVLPTQHAASGHHGFAAASGSGWKSVQGSETAPFVQLRAYKGFWECLWLTSDRSENFQLSSHSDEDQTGHEEASCELSAGGGGG